MNKEKDFFKTCFNTVAGLEVKNESQAIAKEVVLSEIENLQQENKILKENAENNDKVVDKVNWENMLLKKKYENAVADYETTMSELQELKKQLKEYKRLGFKHLNNKCNKLETQQKEFIEWLETMNRIYQNEYKDIDTAEHYNCVLQKYKEIIGDN